MEIDITIEFYQKNATYISPITKAKTSIDIKKVVVFISNRHSNPIKKVCQCLITSTKGVIYDLNELTFEPKHTLPMGLKKSS